MNVSETSLSKLISARKEELARLLEWRGTNFPVVERQNDLRISFIELELEDLEKLNNQPQLNENQQIVLDELQNKYDSVAPYLTIYELVRYPGFVGEAYNGLNPKEELQVLEVFVRWALEQEEKE